MTAPPPVDLPPRLLPLLGELAWHSLTRDPTIAEVSRGHLASVRDAAARHLPPPRPGDPPRRFLEIASYAHVTGDLLAAEGWEATLLDASPHTLRLGRRVAREEGIGGEALRVAGDFHDLPFSGGAFDLVYVASALHHSEAWGTVLDEAFRVLRPGGVLLLENEPTARIACFHRFRSNRPEGRTPFEARLHDLGILRTVAEPYLGSRPESLFGMTENQSIALADLLARVGRHGAVVERTLDTNATLGDAERRWIRWRRLGSLLNGWHVSLDLARRVAKARGAFSPVDGGLGFSLPGRREVAELARRTARSLARMGRGWDEVVVAETFGAPVRLAARKAGRDEEGAGRLPPLLRRRCPEDDGVLLGFGGEADRLLAGVRSSVATLQEGSDGELAAPFPPEAWEIRRGPDGAAAAWLRGRSGEIVLDGDGGDRLVVLRLHGSPGGSPPVEVRLRRGGELLHSFRLFRLEAWVVARVLRCAPGERLVLERDGGEGGAEGPFVLVPSLFCLPLGGGREDGGASPPG